MIWQAKKIVWFRRAVQILAVAFMLLVPALARYNNYLAARELDKCLDKWEGSIAGETLAAIDGTLRAMPGGERERVGRMIRDRKKALERVQFARGGPWSAQIGSLSLTDPLAGAESIAASKNIPWVLIVGLLGPVIITILLGRVFCSWICPVGFMLEMTDKLRGVLHFLELPPKDVKVSKNIKYMLLTVGLIMTSILGVPILSVIYPPAVIGRESHEWVFALFDNAEAKIYGLTFAGLTAMSLVLLAIIVMEMTISRRWWCRTMCPGGALYSLLGWLRVVRVQRDSNACTGCGDCVRDCPMGLAPMVDRMGKECDSCGVCVAVCGDDALGYGLTKGSDIEGFAGLPRSPKKLEVIQV